MIYYAVVDTNVLVSALLSGHDDTATVIVLQKILSGEIIPLYSMEILREYQEVLIRKKFHFDRNYVQFLVNAIEKYGILIKPEKTGFELPDLKDLPFYEVVMDQQEKNANLVTGNLKHFLRKPFIVTAREFLQIIERNRQE